MTSSDREREADEADEAEESLLTRPMHIDRGDDDDDDDDENDQLPTQQYLSPYIFPQTRTLLYTSHFLATWNSRAFEFGAFLFLATIYPQTLLPASVYALSRAASAALLSPCLGPIIDKANRLRVVRVSIVGQRVAIALSCVLLYFMAQHTQLRGTTLWSAIVLALLSILACLEKLSSITNTIAVERDWVVIIAADNETRLQMLNSQMRRIDLFCKLIAPLAIALVHSAFPTAAIIATGSVTFVSAFVEYFTIMKVYNEFPDLRLPKTVGEAGSRKSMWSKLKQTLSGTATYVHHRAFLPSLCLALLYLTVLSFAGQMITYLVALGLSSSMVGVLRGVAAMFELSATWLAPKLMQRLGPVRSGIWFLNWEIVCVAVACAFCWMGNDPTTTAAGTVTAIIASRVGLWGFDLSAQIIVQEEVESEDRGTFSSQEFALQNTFEVLAFASTIIFPKPAQFKYPASVSAAAVALAGVLYAAFVRSRRGHLIHVSRCINTKDRHHWWQQTRIEEYEAENYGVLADRIVTR